MPDVFLFIPKHKVHEGTTFTANAKFRSSANAAQAPTTAKYRVDCLTTGKKITDWTSLTAAASIDITITATHNAIQNAGNAREKKQLTVTSDPDLSTQTRSKVVWHVTNNRAF